MKRIFSSSQIIGRFTQEQKDFEVCATADANFNEGPSQLVMELDSFVRPLNLRAKEKHLKAGWLPKSQRIKESVSLEEAPDLARDIFHRWVRTVRQAIPSPVHG
jgi:hypothetical protein